MLRLWADVDGYTVCMSATFAPGKTSVPDYVFHDPMPEGMRGAPGTIN